MTELPLAGDILLGQLIGRRWVETRRFDDHVPTALTATLQFGDAGNTASIAADDGYKQYDGGFQLDGDTIVGFGFESNVSCGPDLLDLSHGTQITLFDGESVFELIGGDDEVIAEFTDLESLPPADETTVPGTWLLDQLSVVHLTSYGTLHVPCDSGRWEIDEGRLTAELQNAGPAGCSTYFGDIEMLVTDTALRELITGGADVRVVDDTLVLSNNQRVMTLRQPPVVEPDPAGITLAAGAAFGIEPGLGVSPDDVLAAVVPRLGQPTHDTGWLEPEPLGSDDGTSISLDPCQLTDYRELWWGDLVFGFWGRGQRTALMFWNVGDRANIVAPHPEPYLPSPEETAGLSTEHGVGIGIGERAALLPDAVNIAPLRYQVDGLPPDAGGQIIAVISAGPESDADQPSPNLRQGEYLVVDAMIQAFGVEIFDCF